MPADDPDVRLAYAVCAQLAHDHYENFPVASRLLPAELRPHVAAVYAFARIADDFADEGAAPAAVRLIRLRRWGERLRLAAWSAAAGSVTPGSVTPGSVTSGSVTSGSAASGMATSGMTASGMTASGSAVGSSSAPSGAPPGAAPESAAAVDAAGRESDALAAGEAGAFRRTVRSAPDHPDADAIFLALGETIRACRLPIGLFEDLLSAFRQDVTVTRYATWADLLDYCRRSAHPVGRIVLRIAGYRDDALDLRSDAICAALQITNMLQDVGRDWRTGRLYLPAEIFDACGASTADLDRDVAASFAREAAAGAGRAAPRAAPRAGLTPAWRAAIRECADATRGLFTAGRPLCDLVGGRLRLELRFTWLGGMRILERLARTGYDPLARRPVLGWRDALPLVWRACVWT